MCGRRAVGFPGGDGGQAGSGGPVVDQAVGETRLGGGKSPGRGQWEQRGMHHEGGHGEEALEAGEHGVLGHAVVVLAGEAGFQALWETSAFT